MEILSHRGLWVKQSEKNSSDAFKNSFLKGFGTETDIRDYLGEIVISHDPPKGKELSFKRFLEIYIEYGYGLPLALNIKADGLQKKAGELMKMYNVSNYFFFDMSVPDCIYYLNNNLPYFTRQSEIEHIPALLADASGVWMDMFYSDWVSNNDVALHLSAEKKVCLVSPELHKRDHLSFWNLLKKWKNISDNRIMLCTDYPEAAEKFFFQKEIH